MSHRDQDEREDDGDDDDGDIGYCGFTTSIGKTMSGSTRWLSRS